MHRNKYGSQYFTLVGGRVSGDETIEQALVREVMEETGLTVTAAQLVFTEAHAEPYNEQYIFLCNVAPNTGAAIQEWAEEAMMNRLDANTHRLVWTDVKQFATLPFRTPQLQSAIVKGLAKGFPKQPVQL